MTPAAKFVTGFLIVTALAGAIFLVMKFSGPAKPLCNPGFHAVTSTEYRYAYRYLPMTAKWGYGWGNDTVTTCVEGAR